MRTHHVRHLANIIDIRWSRQWCSRKYLGTGAVQNISMVLFLEREH